MRPASTDYPLVLRRTLLSAMGDGCFSVAKGAAYSALLSFFPVLTSATAILVQSRAEAVSRKISSFLFEVVPPGTEDAVQHAFAVRGNRPAALLIVAAALSLLAASGVVGSLIQGFQNAYHVTERRSIPRSILLNMTLVLLSSVPLMLAATATLFGDYVDQAIIGWLHVDPVLTPLYFWWRLLYRTVRYAVAFAAAVAVISMLYYFGPLRKQRWGRVWRGAVLATTICLLATAGFAWYVRHLANYNVLYGSIATSIALVVWMYLLAVIALLGCEFNAVCERLTQPATEPAAEGEPPEPRAAR